jgi:hypothetical protein
MVWRAQGHASNMSLIVAGVEQIGKLCIYYVPCAGMAFGGEENTLTARRNENRRDHHGLALPQRTT